MENCWLQNDDLHVNYTPVSISSNKKLWMQVECSRSKWSRFFPAFCTPHIFLPPNGQLVALSDSVFCCLDRQTLDDQVFFLHLSATLTWFSWPYEDYCQGCGLYYWVSHVTRCGPVGWVPGEWHSPLKSHVINMLVLGVVYLRNFARAMVYQACSYKCPSAEGFVTCVACTRGILAFHPSWRQLDIRRQLDIQSTNPRSGWSIHPVCFIC